MPLTIVPTATSFQVVLASSFTISSTASFQDTGVSLTLPAAGTYLIFATIRAAIELTGGNDGFIDTKLYNATDAADVAQTVREIVYLNVTGQVVHLTVGFTHLVTVSGSKVIKLYAQRDTSVDGTFGFSVILSDTAGYSNLGYIKLSP